MNSRPINLVFSIFSSLLPSVLYFGGGIDCQRLPALQALDQMRSIKGNSAGEIKKTMSDAVPGLTYPMLSEIPRTSFSCEQVGQPGYYADQDAYCQVYRRCDPEGGMSSFICPNKTLFNQITLVCDWWFNVNCAKAAAFYSYSNPRLFSFSGKFLEDAITPPSPLNFNRVPSMVPFQNSRPLTSFQLEDSFGHRDDQEASEVQFEFAETLTTPGPETKKRLPATTLQTTVSPRTPKQEIEEAPLLEGIRGAPGGSLFFASERFAMPLFEAPPLTDFEAQDDRPVPVEKSSSWSLPSFESEASITARTVTVASSTGTGAGAVVAANKQEEAEPKATRNSFRVLRPTHAATINPSFFPN